VTAFDYALTPQTIAAAARSLTTNPEQ